jgi:acyl-CoA synthetase (AMP-forming)/AMP-acid ligase II
MAMNLGILFDRAVRDNGNEVAIIDHDTGVKVTFAELAARTNRVANALLASSLAKGDRAALLMPNCHEAIAIDGAFMKTGIIKVPLNARVSASEIGSMLRDSGSSILFTHALLADLAREAVKGCTDLRLVVVIGASSPIEGWLTFDEFITDAPDTPVLADLVADDVYKLQYTSGTSGVLKAAMLTHKNWICLTRANLMRRGTNIATARVAAYIAPITHAAGGSILANLICGSKNLLLRKFDPVDFLRMVEEYRINDVLLVPTMINMILECKEISHFDISSLDNITYGTAPISPERIRQAIEIFGPVLTQGYGQTESTAVISMLNNKDHLAVNDPALIHRLSSAGRPSFECEARIVDDEGYEVEKGEVGEIIVRGDMVMKGYWNAPELTAETIRDGWLFTRDMGRIDDDGYLYLVDRKSDMIISGGFNVYPAEVENALYEHPSVYEAAVVSVPDPKWGEAVKAVVALKPDARATEEELIAHCRVRLAHFKAPSSVDFIAELPKSGVGKILRRVVRESYWSGLERRIS